MRILLTGANGQLGPYVVDALQAAGHQAVAWRGRADVDLTNDEALRAAFSKAAPQAVIHAAAMSKPAEAFRQPDVARAINVDATRQLVDLCDAADVKLVFVSTDMVFDGDGAPYTEADPPTPRSVYGKTKLAAENEVLDVQRNMIVRVSLLYGPSRHDTPTLFDKQAAAVRDGQPVRVFDDEWRTPLAINDAAAGLVAAATSEATGLYHLGGPDRMSRLDMGRVLCDVLGADPACLRAASRLSIESDEPRPRDLSFDSTRWSQTFPEAPRRSFREAAMTFVNRTP